MKRKKGKFIQVFVLRMSALYVLPLILKIKTMVITDALEMKQSGPIDEDVTRFIESYDLDEGAYSIVANIDTQNACNLYDPPRF